MERKIWEIVYLNLRVVKGNILKLEGIEVDPPEKKPEVMTALKDHLAVKRLSAKKAQAIMAYFMKYYRTENVIDYHFREDDEVKLTLCFVPHNFGPHDSVR